MLQQPELLLVCAAAAAGALAVLSPPARLTTVAAGQPEWAGRGRHHEPPKSVFRRVLVALAIAFAFWAAGAALSQQHERLVDIAASLALVGIGAWIICLSLWTIHISDDARGRAGTGDAQTKSAGNDGRAAQRVQTEFGELRLSIVGDGGSAHFRLSGAKGYVFTVSTIRDDCTRQIFTMLDCGGYWESLEPVPTPHRFTATITMERGDVGCSYRTTANARSAGAASGRFGDPRETGPSSPSAMTKQWILVSSSLVANAAVFFAAGKYGAGLATAMGVIFLGVIGSSYALRRRISPADAMAVTPNLIQRCGQSTGGLILAVTGIVAWLGVAG